MTSNRVLRELENVSSIGNPNKLLGSEKKPGLRVKSKALGDVRNTLHARPINSGSVAKTPNQKFNELIKEPGISRNFLSTGKKIQKKNVAAKCSIQNNCNDDWHDLLETHNHELCIKAEDPCFSNYLYEYKLSEKDIETLVKSIKPLRLTAPKYEIASMEPCEDIQIYADAWDLERSSDSIPDELVMPEISAPV